MLIKSKQVYISGLFMPAELEIENGKITRIFEYEANTADMDFGDLRIVPGFIDIHCHGAYGFDTNYAKPEGLKKWAKNIVHEGVTGFLATTVTQKHPVLERAVRNVAAVKRTQNPGPDGADILGIHMEGPYLDAAHRGAHPGEAIVPPSLEEFQKYEKAAEGLIRVVTLAPEHDTDFELTRYCRSRGIVVSIGHTGASFSQAALAVANGARSFTHTFNGQTGFHHRQDGVAGAALRFRSICSEIICDCLHVAPEALHIFFACKAPGRAVMISDSLMCKGLPAGTRFLFGGQECEVMPDGTAHLAGTKTIAGSTMRMIDGLKNLVTRAQVPFETALDSCTINPASLLGMDDHLGRIAAGYDADLVVLTDDYEIAAVYCKGIQQC